MGLMYSPRGGGNATVPNDAPILPAQAFVDNIHYITDWILTGGDPLDLSGKGITSIDVIQIRQAIQFGLGFGPIDLSANAITNTNAILREFASHVPGDIANPFTLDLSGGTNAAPTGQGLTDKAALITAGWTAMTN